MKIDIYFIFCLLMLTSLAGCADEQPVFYEQKKGVLEQDSLAEKTVTQANSKDDHYKKVLLESGDIFIFTVGDDGEVVGSYFSMDQANSETMFRRIIWILERTEAKASFLQLVESRMANSRRIKKDNFILTLLDMDGSAHKFEYSSLLDDQFFTLNYHSNYDQ